MLAIMWWMTQPHMAAMPWTPKFHFQIDHPSRTFLGWVWHTYLRLLKCTLLENVLDNLIVDVGAELVLQGTLRSTIKRALSAMPVCWPYGSAIRIIFRLCFFDR